MIPVATPAPGVSVKVLAGEVAGVRGPVDPGATQPLYIDVRLEPGAAYAIDLPTDHNAFVYVYEGAAEVAEPPQPLARGEIAVLSPGDVVRVASKSGARLIAAAGRPLREPVAKYGPFVMNTQDELRQAFADYQAGRF